MFPSHQLRSIVTVTGMSLAFALVFQSGPRGAHELENVPGVAVAFVVNPRNPVSELSRVELRAIFVAGRRHWTDGRRVTLVMREPGNPQRAAVLRGICQMTEDAFARHFLLRQFVGDAPSDPKTLTSAAGVRRFVANVPGAIGYVAAEELDASVKVLRLDGLAPGDPDYVLRLHGSRNGDSATNR